MFNGLRNLKNIGATVLDRTELYCKLIAVETKIETGLLMRRLVWAGVGAMCAIFAFAMLHLVIITIFWSGEYRIASVISILLVDAAVAGVALHRACKPATQESFLATKHQLAEDMKFVRESI